MSRMNLLRKFNCNVVFGNHTGRVVGHRQWATVTIPRQRFQQRPVYVTTWYTQNGMSLRNLLGAYMVTETTQPSSRTYATQPPTFSSTTKPSEPEDNNPINVVLKEIQVQEKQFKRKLEQDDANSARKLRALESEALPSPKQLELLRNSSPTSTNPPPPLILEENPNNNKITPLTPKEQLREPLKFQGKPQSLKLIYPSGKPPEKLVPPSFKYDSNSVLPPPPMKLTPQPPQSTGVFQAFPPKFPPKFTSIKSPVVTSQALTPLPKIAESNTHKIKMLIASSMKPSEGSILPPDVNTPKFKADVKSRILMMFQPEKKELKTTSRECNELEEHIGPVDMLGNPIPPKESRLITSMVMDKEMEVVTGMNICGLNLAPRKREDGEVSDGLVPIGGPVESATGGKGQSQSGQDSKKWTILRYTLEFFGVALTALGGYVMYKIGQPKCDEWGNVILDKYSHMPLVFQYFYRVKDQMEVYQKMIKEPSREKLLPDVMQPPYYQPPYTLVLELTDLLVHPEWTYKTGWRFKKRPGLDEFLEALYTRFEVVVYTAQMATTVFPLLETLDNKNLITYKLVRDATNFVDGDHVKDLDKINRDLRKVVVVDWNPRSVKLHKCNLFQIPRWEGNDDDRTLFDLAAFLIAISEWEVQDVRSVLEYYGQFDNPLMKFKENQMQALRAAQI